MRRSSGGCYKSVDYTGKWNVCVCVFIFSSSPAHTRDLSRVYIRIPELAQDIAIMAHQPRRLYFVCQQDFTKAIEQIHAKLVVKMGHGPRRTH